MISTPAFHRLLLAGAIGLTCSALALAHIRIAPSQTGGGGMRQSGSHRM